MLSKLEQWGLLQAHNHVTFFENKCTLKFHFSLSGAFWINRLAKSPSVANRSSSSFTGFVLNNVFDIEDKIQTICKSLALNNLNQEHNLIEALKTNCRKTVKEKTGKRPYTNVNLVRI